MSQNVICCCHIRQATAIVDGVDYKAEFELDFVADGQRQWSWIRLSVMWLKRSRPNTSRAAAFWTWTRL